MEYSAQFLIEHPNVSVEVAGYTDSIGSDSDNKRLSARRARAVYEYLLDRGIAPSRLMPVGYGATRFIAPNKREDGTDYSRGRPENRRVELNLLEPPPAPLTEITAGTAEITEKRLLGLLRLIESSRSINDFTAERIGQFMSANLSHDDKGSNGFSDRPSDRWIAGYGVQTNSQGQPQFEAYFQEVPLSSHPPMTDICRLDFAEFARRLEEIGFVRHTVSYLHGERGWDWFDSAEKQMVIEVYAHGEANHPTELISHECIYNVIIK